jgi:hypothetical protein
MHTKPCKRTFKVNPCKEKPAPLSAARTLLYRQQKLQRERQLRRS